MKKQLQHSLIALMALIVVPIITTSAQEKKEISDSIVSKVLNEKRDIKIRLPKEYKEGSDKKYEVIYILDGEWNMNNFSFIYNFAMEDKFVPPVILVALPNTYIDGANMRDRDFLPKEMKDNKLAGKADNFLKFIKTEVIPYINSKYPSNRKNSLYGHSYGGVFTFYAMLAEPELFNTYYCTDPPLSWNNNFLRNLATEKFKDMEKLKKNLWIAGTTYNLSILAMKSFLEKNAPKKLRWETAHYENERHNSVRLKGIYDGIKFRNR